MDRQVHIVESFLLGAFKYRLTGSYAHILEEFGGEQEVRPKTNKFSQCQDSPFIADTK